MTNNLQLYHKTVTLLCQWSPGEQITGLRSVSTLFGLSPLAVGVLCLIPGVVVTAASVQDRDGAKLVFQRLTGSCKKLRKVWVDGGYRGQLLDWVLAHCRFCLTVILRTDT